MGSRDTYLSCEIEPVIRPEIVETYPVTKDALLVMEFFNGRTYHDLVLRFLIKGRETEFLEFVRDWKKKKLEEQKAAQ